MLAEPSALVGMSGDTAYPFDTNLIGAYNCLELARRDSAQFVFLSTSRVYLFIVLYVFLEHHLNRGDYLGGQRPR